MKEEPELEKVARRIESGLSQFEEWLEEARSTFMDSETDSLILRKVTSMLKRLKRQAEKGAQKTLFSSLLQRYQKEAELKLEEYRQKMNQKYNLNLSIPQLICLLTALSSGFPFPTIFEFEETNFAKEMNKYIERKAEASELLRKISKGVAQLKESIKKRSRKVPRLRKTLIRDMQKYNRVVEGILISDTFEVLKKDPETKKILEQMRELKRMNSLAYPFNVKERRREEVREVIIAPQASYKLLEFDRNTNPARREREMKDTIPGYQERIQALKRRISRLEASLKHAYKLVGRKLGCKSLVDFAGRNFDSTKRKLEQAGFSKEEIRKIMKARKELRSSYRAKDNLASKIQSLEERLEGMRPRSFVRKVRIES
jgi:hypothetical protein